MHRGAVADGGWESAARAVQVPLGGSSADERGLEKRVWDELAMGAGAMATAVGVSEGVEAEGGLAASAESLGGG